MRNQSSAAVNQRRGYPQKKEECHMRLFSTDFARFFLALGFWWVSHHCCDPCCSTQCHAHSVAALSAVSKMSQGRCAPPPRRLCHACLASKHLSCQRYLRPIFKREAIVTATLSLVALHRATKQQKHKHGMLQGSSVHTHSTGAHLIVPRKWQMHMALARRAPDYSSKLCPPKI